MFNWKRYIYSGIRPEIKHLAQYLILKYMINVIDNLYNFTYKILSRPTSRLIKVRVYSMYRSHLNFLFE